MISDRDLKIESVGYWIELVVFLYKIESTSKRITFIKKYDTIVLQKVTKYKDMGDSIQRLLHYNNFLKNSVGTVLLVNCSLKYVLICDAFKWDVKLY